MNNYKVVSPSVNGLLSDDNLYFEGISRPSVMSFIEDSVIIDENKTIILEKYFNDIYNLFLRKVSSFALYDNVNDEDSIKIQALLQELIKVKKLIVKTSEVNNKNLI